MSSIILITITRLVHPVLLIFSVFLLLRGHNEPGGGFSGGLLAASAFVLYALAHNGWLARQALWIDPHLLIGAGLLLAILSGLIPVIAGHPFLTGYWITIYVPGPGDFHIGTPLLFDVGVYLVVVGITMLVVLTMIEN